MQTKCSTLLRTRIAFTTINSKRTLIYTWERRTDVAVADDCLQKAGNYSTNVSGERLAAFVSAADRVGGSA